MSADLKVSRCAVIDVGTNSVKVLVAEVTEIGVHAIWETSQQTRLGREFYDSHRLLPEAIALTADVVSEYTEKARELGASDVRVIATSAARDAVNGEELMGAIHRSTGIWTEVLSGDTEADWGYLGVRSDERWYGKRLLMLDVGGGSTEIIYGVGAEPLFRESFALGSVRLWERFKPHPNDAKPMLAKVRLFLDEFLSTKAMPKLARVLETNGPIDVTLGVGGSTAILAMIEMGRSGFDRDAIEASCISKERLTLLTERLWGMPLVERQRLPGLPPERADVILMGAAIYEAILRNVSFPELRPSLRGIRYGALLANARASMHTWQLPSTA